MKSVCIKKKLNKNKMLFDAIRVSKPFWQRAMSESTAVTWWVWGSFLWSIYLEKRPIVWDSAAESATLWSSLTSSHPE